MALRRNINSGYVMGPDDEGRETAAIAIRHLPGFEAAGRAPRSTAVTLKW